MRPRCPVARINPWLSVSGQRRREADPRTVQRIAEFALAVTFLLAVQPIDYRNRWMKDLSPIL
jgi:hypothetical protein